MCSRHISTCAQRAILGERSQCQTDCVVRRRTLDALSTHDFCLLKPLYFGFWLVVGTPSVCEVFREFTFMPEIRSFCGIFGSLTPRWKGLEEPRRMAPVGQQTDIGINVKSPPNHLFVVVSTARPRGQTSQNDSTWSFFLKTIPRGVFWCARQ